MDCFKTPRITAKLYRKPASRSGGVASALRWVSGEEEGLRLHQSDGTGICRAIWPFFTPNKSTEQLYQLCRPSKHWSKSKIMVQLIN
jgi:hypothetical protein